VSLQRLKARILESQYMTVARQRLDKHIPAALNTYATIEKLLEAVFSTRSMSYQVQNM
jgi:hypothetical protein